MALFDILIWIFLLLIVGSSMGALGAKLATSRLNRLEEKKSLLIVNGKIKNILKLEGRLINVDKFTYRDDDGEIQKKVKLSDLVKKTQSAPLKQEKRTHIQGIKDYFKRTWNSSKGKKK